MSSAPPSAAPCRPSALGRATAAALLLGLAGLLSPPALPATMTTAKQYQVAEIRLKSPTVHRNPFLVEVSAVFRGPGGRSLQVPGFYDGGQTWVVRYSLPRTGDWTYRTRSEDPALSGKEGQIRVTRRDPDSHGVFRVDPKHPRHFAWEDGTPVFVLGFECDWLWALDPPEGSGTPKLDALLNLISARGFNYVVTNLYAYDTSWARGNTSQWDYGPPGTFPWEGTNDAPRHDRLNLAFWRHYDRVVEALRKRGMIAHIMMRVYNKLVSWPPKESPEDWLYYRTIIARYQAFPNIVWDFSKESYYEKDTDYKVRVMKQVGEWDAYDHPRTAHDDVDELYDNGTWDFLELRADQNHESWGQTLLRQRRRLERPVMNIEYGYERGAEKLPTYGVMQDWQEVLRRTWEILCAGGHVNYYYSNTSWDLVKWDPEPPGWSRYKLLRDFFESTRHWELEPHPELVLSGEAWCLANPGREYVVFQSRAAPFRLSVAAGEPLKAQWLDPETGEREEGPEVAAGERELSPPWSDRPCVLHLRGAEGG